MSLCTRRPAPARSRRVAGRDRRLRRPARDRERRGVRHRALCLMDSLGCMMLALNFPACVRRLGPVVPGTVVPHGARVPGTPSSSTRCRRRSTSAASSAGSTSTTPGWPRSGATRRTTSARSSRAPTTSAGRRAAARASAPLTRPRRAHGDDPGARDPGRARAGEQLQPRRPRPRHARARGVSTAVATAMLGGDAGGDRQRRVATPGSTAGRCAPTATPPTPGRARAGRRATRPAAACGTR